MGFHRRTAPTYGSLPAGYDYLNNPALNGDPGTAAPADGKKASGANQGTYFVAFGEDATSSNTNRGLTALAENTDLLDDLFRTSQVVMRVQTGVSPGVAPTALSSLVITGDVYVGSPSDSPATANDVATRERLIKIVDSNDNEIEVGGPRVVTTLIHNGASVNQVGVPAGGFYTNPTITISPGIPAGTSYRVYYLARRTLNDIIKSKPAEFFFEQIRTAHRVDAQVRSNLRELQGGSKDWYDGWTSSIDSLARRGIDGMYRNGQDGPTYPPAADFEFIDLVAQEVDSAGSGAWIYRNGPALTIYGGGEAVYTDPIQALLRLEADDTGSFRGTTGMVTIGNRQSQASIVGESNFKPGLATMMSTVARRQTGSVHATDPKTRILSGAALTLTTVSNDPETGESYIEVPVGQYFWNASFKTAINIGYDLIEISYVAGGVTFYRTYVMVAGGSSAAPTNSRRMRVRQIDGNVPDFAGATSALFRRWHSITFAVGDGGGPHHSQANGYFDSLKLNGAFFSTPTTLSSTDFLTAGAPFFNAREQGSADIALAWGGLGVGTDPPTGAAQKGYLSGNGGITGDGAAAFDLGFSSTAGGVQTLLGPYPFSPLALTVGSATTTLACPYDTDRFFTFTSNTTPTAGQTVTVTFTGSPPLSTGMEMTIVFVQPASGASAGAVDISSWPATAKFGSEADKHPAIGYSVMTVWKGTYISSNWRFTKHVYS